MSTSKRFCVTYHLSLNEMAQCVCQELRAADQPRLEIRFLTCEKVMEIVREMLSQCGQSYIYRDGYDFMFEDVIVKLEELFPELVSTPPKIFFLPDSPPNRVRGMA
jgi:hypothetical protein